MKKIIAFAVSAVAIMGTSLTATPIASAEPFSGCNQFTIKDGGRTYYKVRCGGLNKSYQFRAHATCNRLGVVYTSTGAWLPYDSNSWKLSTAICGLLSTMTSKRIDTRRV